jgi:hypothetical protein
MAAYENAVAGQPAQIGSSRIKPGTLRALAASYFATPIAACAASAAVVYIFALRPFAFIVINVASFSSRRRASLAAGFHQTDVYHCAAREEAPPDKASVDVAKWGGWPRQRSRRFGRALRACKVAAILALNGAMQQSSMVWRSVIGVLVVLLVVAWALIDWSYLQSASSAREHLGEIETSWRGREPIGGGFFTRQEQRHRFTFELVRFVLGASAALLSCLA